MNEKAVLKRLAEINEMSYQLIGMCSEIMGTEVVKKHRNGLFSASEIKRLSKEFRNYDEMEMSFSVENSIAEINDIQNLIKLLLNETELIE